MKETLTNYLLNREVMRKDTLYWIDKHKKWCKVQHTTPQQLTEKQAMDYIEHLLAQYYHRPTINYIVDRITWYYTYLTEEQQIIQNPFISRKVARAKKRTLKKATSMKYVPNRRDI